VARSHRAITIHGHIKQEGISQRELARRLGEHETQVSRDERNEYFGITLERAAKILDALNVRLRTQVEIEPLPPFPVPQASCGEFTNPVSAI
jgi:transcriptional regulator with XRE-family HTH domain